MRSCKSYYCSAVVFELQSYILKSFAGTLRANAVGLNVSVVVQGQNVITLEHKQEVIFDTSKSAITDDLEHDFNSFKTFIVKCHDCRFVVCKLYHVRVVVIACVDVELQRGAHHVAGMVCFAV